MNPPRVSAVVPNYNHARHLPQCLGALLQQSVLPHEIIVVDDGSTDDSLAVLREWSARSPLIQVHRNARNQGVVAAMNRGLEIATGDFVAFLAADDEVLPGLFEHTLPMAAQHPECGLVSGLSEWRDEARGLTWLHGTTMPNRACYVSPNEMVRLAKAGRLAMSGQNALFRKAALVAAGGWIPDLRWHTDWFGACVVAFRHGICHVPEVLSIFNLRPASYYSTARSWSERRAVLDRLLELLESGTCSDVAPRICASGMLGGFGVPMLRVVAGQRRYWRFLNAGFLRRAGRRGAEAFGRRFLPRTLARACIRVFYGKP